MIIFDLQFILKDSDGLSTERLSLTGFLMTLLRTLIEDMHFLTINSTQSVLHATVINTSKSSVSLNQVRTSSQSKRTTSLSILLFNPLVSVLMNLKEFSLESTTTIQLLPGENEKENLKQIITFLKKKSRITLEKVSPSPTGGMNTKRDIGSQQLLVMSISTTTLSSETDSS